MSSLCPVSSNTSRPNSPSSKPTMPMASATGTARRHAAPHSARSPRPIACATATVVPVSNPITVRSNGIWTATPSDR